MFQQDAHQDFPFNGKQEDTSMVITSLPFSFHLFRWTIKVSLNSCGVSSWFHMDWCSLVDFPVSSGPPAAISYDGLIDKSFITAQYPDCCLHFRWPMEFIQEVLERNLWQMANFFITNDRWSIENTMKAFCPSFKKLFLVSNQCDPISTEKKKDADVGGP